MRTLEARLHRLVIPCALALALCVACATSTAANHEAPAQDLPRADAAALWADVRWLADDAREGRRAGTEACRVAGEWIAERFRALGLEPLGTAEYLQEFTVPLDPQDGGGSQVTIGGVGADAGTWGAPDVVPLFCSERGDARGPLVFCGYGIENDERAWNDYAGLELTGAVAFLVRGTPPLSDETETAPSSDTEVVSKDKSWGPSGSIFTKVMTAKRHGARAVILAPDPRDAAGGVLAFDTGHSARAGIPCLMVSSEIARALMPSYERALAKPASSAAPEVRDAPHLRAEPRAVELTADVVRALGPAFNVLARLRGVDSTRAIVIGAHYDHLGRGGTGSLAPDQGGEIHNGADDNASGTAVVLEVARLLRAGDAPPCDIVFALWSGEELGLLGSEHWAENPTLPLQRVRANLNLDMVGRASEGRLQVLGAGTSPPFAGWMSAAGASAGLKLAVNAAGGALGGSSDHQSFVKRKIPALHLFSGLHTDYHKPSDDIERFDADGAAKVARLTIDLARRMGRERELAFVQPRVDNERPQMARGAFRTWFGSVPSYTFEGPGLLIDGTSAGSPAERAGLLGGDVIRQVGDVTIDTIYDFTYALQLYKPGDVVLVRFERDGARDAVRVTLASRDLE